MMTKRSLLGFFDLVVLALVCFLAPPAVRTTGAGGAFILFKLRSALLWQY